MKIANVLKPMMANFAKTRFSFYRDRFILATLMNSYSKISSSVMDRVKPVNLPNCVAYQITPLKWESDRVILYLHGGAMCLPMWKFYIPLAYQLAELTNSRVLLPDYRLAPDSPFPAALDDSIDSANWICRNWISRDRLFIVGDSAGGNLALNTVINAGSSAGLALMSPWLDLSHSSKWWSIQNEDHVVYPEPARRAAWLYVRGEDDWSFGKNHPEFAAQFETQVKDPRVSPLFADMKFAATTPIIIQASDSERLLGDSLGMWDKIGGSTIDCLVPSPEPLIKVTHAAHELSIWKDVPHVWQVTRPWSSQAKLAVEDISSFVQKIYSN